MNTCHYSSPFTSELRCRRRSILALLATVVLFAACAPDPPDTIAGTQAQFVPIVIDPLEEARAFNGGQLFEFVSDEAGYISTPRELPAGEVMITLTYVGDHPAPHSLSFEGLNGDQPVVAVDFPGSNNGVIVLPPGELVFDDGAPGNRAAGHEGELRVIGEETPATGSPSGTTLSWVTAGNAFTASPNRIVPADVPVVLELSVTDTLPHSVAFENVRGGQPLVAVDGPGTNHREVELPAGTYIYYCAVPGHREAGMEGLLTAD